MRKAKSVEQEQTTMFKPQTRYIVSKYNPKVKLQRNGVWLGAWEPLATFLSAKQAGEYMSECRKMGIEMLSIEKME